MASVNIPATGAAAVGAATTLYFALGSGLANSGTETVEQLLCRTAGTFSNLYCRISANDRGASTLRFRKNTANGNQTISVGGSGTGEFQDSSNTDAVVAGDVVNFSYVSGAGGATTTVNGMGVSFTASANTATRWNASASLSLSTTSATTFAGINGVLTSQATEANVQTKVRVAGTVSNAYVYAFTNTSTDPIVITLRKNGVDTTLVLSITALTTGAFEDTTHSVTVAAGDLLDWKIVTGTVTVAANLRQLACDFVTTNNGSQLIALNGGTNFSNNTTTYTPIAGAIVANATESTSQYKTQVPLVTSNLMVYCSANTSNGDAVVTLRKNASNLTNTLTVTAGATGLFEDTTHSDAFAIGDEMSVGVVIAGNSGTITLRLVSVAAVTANALTGTAVGTESSTATLTGIGALSGTAAGTSTADANASGVLGGNTAPGRIFFTLRR